MKMGVQTLLP